MNVPRYRKKPVEVEAIRYNGYNGGSILLWADEQTIQESLSLDGGPQANRLLIPTLEGIMEARPGDWIIRGVAGEFYPCKPEIFEAPYDEVRPIGPECVTRGLPPAALPIYELEWMTRGTMRHEDKPDPRLPTPEELLTAEEIEEERIKVLGRTPEEIEEERARVMAEAKERAAKITRATVEEQLEFVKKAIELGCIQELKP